MKRPREVAHKLANEWDASCCLSDELGWSHGVRCESITAAIATRDAEHQEAVATAKAEGRREAFGEALGIVADCVSASASNPIWDACRTAIAEDIRAARDRGNAMITRTDRETVMLEALERVRDRASPPRPSPP